MKDYPSLLDCFKWRIILHLDYSVPLVVADKKKTKSKSLDRIWTRSTHFKRTVFILLIAKDQLTGKCADYLPKLISI